VHAKALPLVAAAALLSSCGDSSNEDGILYAFVAPSLNSVRMYSETIVDNENNTIDLTFTDTVTAVNVNGTYSVLQEDPNHESVVVNGTDYLIQTQTIQLNNSGQEISYAYVDTAGAPLNCSFTPHGPGPNFPVAVGMTWSLSYTLACAEQTPVTYVQTGTVVDVESVTVPAGTFNALKLQSTLTWTDAQGAERTQTVTNWRDELTSVSVKQSVTITYSGTLPTSGYPVSREIILQSRS
jgi:hypothetical protein